MSIKSMSIELVNNEIKNYTIKSLSIFNKIDKIIY